MTDLAATEIPYVPTLKLIRLAAIAHADYQRRLLDAARAHDLRPFEALALLCLLGEVQSVSSSDLALRLAARDSSTAWERMANESATRRALGTLYARDLVHGSPRKPGVTSQLRLTEAGRRAALAIAEALPVEVLVKVTAL